MFREREEKEERERGGGGEREEGGRREKKEGRGVRLCCCFWSIACVNRDHGSSSLGEWHSRSPQ